MVTEIELFESPDLIPLDFCLWGWMKIEVYKRKVGTRDESPARILYAAVRIKNLKFNSDEQHAIFAHRVAKCIEVDSGIFEHLL